MEMGMPSALQGKSRGIKLAAFRSRTSVCQYSKSILGRKSPSQQELEPTSEQSLQSEKQSSTESSASLMYVIIWPSDTVGSFRNL